MDVPARYTHTHIKTLQSFVCLCFPFPNCPKTCEMCVYAVSISDVDSITPSISEELLKWIHTHSFSLHLLGTDLFLTLSVSLLQSQTKAYSYLSVSVSLRAILAGKRTARLAANRLCRRARVQKPHGPGK